MRSPVVFQCTDKKRFWIWCAVEWRISWCARGGPAGGILLTYTILNVPHSLDRELPLLLKRWGRSAADVDIQRIGVWIFKNTFTNHPIKLLDHSQAQFVRPKIHLDSTSAYAPTQYRTLIHIHKNPICYQKSKWEHTSAVSLSSIEDSASQIITVSLWEF